MAELTAFDPSASDQLGISVSIRGEGVVVGALQAGFNGAAYLFRQPSTGWQNATEDDKITASDGAALDNFGVSVSISGDLATVGAYLNDDHGLNSGSAYIFDGMCPCPWDLDGDGVVGVVDLIDLLVNWGPCADCNDCPWDFDGNCTVGASDLLALLVNWGLCPCVEGTPPLSLEEELADVCLTQADWDEFEAVMTDPNASQADQDRYKCWMIHYLDHCNKCTCTHKPECPNPDPFI